MREREIKREKEREGRVTSRLSEDAGDAAHVHDRLHPPPTTITLPLLYQPLTSQKVMNY